MMVIIIIIILLPQRGLCIRQVPWNGVTLYKCKYLILLSPFLYNNLLDFMKKLHEPCQEIACRRHIMARVLFFVFFVLSSNDLHVDWPTTSDFSWLTFYSYHLSPLPKTLCNALRYLESLNVLGFDSGLVVVMVVVVSYRVTKNRFIILTSIQKGQPKQTYIVPCYFSSTWRQSLRFWFVSRLSMKTTSRLAKVQRDKLVLAATIVCPVVGCAATNRCYRSKLPIRRYRVW